MRSNQDLLKLVKKAAVEAVGASAPTALKFGGVVQTAPLMINVDQRFVLEEENLILPRSLTDYTITLNFGAEIIATETELDHIHSITGDKKVIIKNGLKKGDSVILLRMQGGQKYLIVDKVVTG